MKEHWNRIVPYVDLSADQLNAMIQPAFPGDHVVRHEILTGGLVNTLYKATLHKFVQPIVVRLYTRDPQACQKDVDLHKFVQDRVPLPTIYHADPQATLHPIPYTITEYVPGPLLRDVLTRGDSRDRAGAMYAAGATLAAIGAHTFERGGFFGPGLKIVQPIDWGAAALQAYIEERLDGGGAALLGADLAARLRRLVQHQAALLHNIPITSALVHADYNEPNVIMQQHGERWRVAAVLDWEFACAGPPLYDMGVMLRNDERRGPEFAPQFVQGFVDHGGALPAHWRTIVKLLDLINLCDFLSKATAGDPVVGDVAALIARTLARLDQPATA